MYKCSNCYLLWFIFVLLLKFQSMNIFQRLQTLSCCPIVWLFVWLGMQMKLLAEIKWPVLLGLTGSPHPLNRRWSKAPLCRSSCGSDSELTASQTEYCLKISREDIYPLAFNERPNHLAACNLVRQQVLPLKPFRHFIVVRADVTFFDRFVILCKLLCRLKVSPTSCIINFTFFCFSKGSMYPCSLN